MGCHSPPRSRYTTPVSWRWDFTLYADVIAIYVTTEHVNSSESGAMRLHAALTPPQQMHTKTVQIQDNNTVQAGTTVCQATSNISTIYNI